MKRNNSFLNSCFLSGIAPKGGKGGGCPKAPFPPPSPINPKSAKVPVLVVKPKCNHCDTIVDSEEKLKAHTENALKKTSSPLRSPEKERMYLGGASCCEPQLSPIEVQRREMQLSDQGGAGFTLTSFTLQEIGAQMCPACDFDMCFPNLDYIEISCKCILREDSRYC